MVRELFHLTVSLKIINVLMITIKDRIQVAWVHIVQYLILAMISLIELIMRLHNRLHMQWLKKVITSLGYYILVLF
ncbi:Uncharacterised protein [Mycobacteroides abscessus]|nr:Uncharacterised protein [Mycobacteroides abscessus]